MRPEITKNTQIITKTMTSEELQSKESGTSTPAPKSTQESIDEAPEGGLRAWTVVAGSAATMFCTFGYLTGFGYVLI